MVHHVRRTILNRSAMKASGAPYAWFHWWACLDSNQEPDRYERPALTIELQAPQQRSGAATIYRARGIPAMPRVNQGLQIGGTRADKAAAQADLTTLDRAL